MTEAEPLRLRAMVRDDLCLIETWLREPHVARWFLVGTSIDDELEDLGRCISGEDPTEALLVLAGDRSIGWCQWYRCDDYPDHAAGVAAQPGDVGIDYAIADPRLLGRGVGTDLIAALVAHVRERHPLAGVVADPEATNLASRRVLEKNDFELVAVRTVASEPTSDPMAIYRLPPKSDGTSAPGASRRPPPDRANQEG